MISATQINYHFDCQTEANQQAERTLLDGISDEAALKKSMSRMKPVKVTIKNDEDQVMGGTSGVALYGNLHIDILWIHEKLRGQGIGKQLMLETEEAGRAHNCTFATVNTMDWEALHFYQKLGYAVEFIREGYEKNSRMYMLRKELSK